MDTMTTTLLTVPAILALVTIARDLGMPSKIAPVVALALGVALGVAEQQLGGLPIYQAAVGGALIGLAASGLYDTGKLIGSKPVQPPVTIEVTEVTGEPTAPKDGDTADV